MSEPSSPSDQTPPAPPAPSFTYGAPEQPAPPTAPDPAPPAYGERIPGYEAPTPPTPAYAQPSAPGYAQPGYAQPGYPHPGYPQPAYGAPGYGQPVPRRRTWDLVLTIILLAVGLIGLVIGLLYAAVLADPVLFQQAMASQGMAVSVDTSGAALIIGVSHPVLYLVALGVSILLIVKKKIAFWVPLTAGVIAAIVFWGTLMAVLLSDPAILNFVR